MRQILTTVSTVAPSTGAANYGPISGPVVFGSGETAGTQPWAVAGTFGNLVIRLDVAPGAGKSWVFALRINGATTALSVTISDSALTARDTTHSVSIAAGDRVTLISTPTGTPTTPGAQGVQSALEFTSTATGESGYGGRCTAIQPSAAATKYAAPLTGEVWITPAVEDLIPLAGTITALYLLAPTAPTSGRSDTGTLYLNGVKQDGTGGTANTTVSLSAGVTSAGSTFAVAVVPGDRVYLEGVKVGTGSEAVGYALRFVAAMDGLAIIAGGSTTLPTTLTQYTTPGWANSAWSSSETPVAADGAVNALAISALRVRLSAAPGTGKTYTLSLRVNGASPSGTPSVTISDLATAGADATGTVTVADTNTWAMRAVPSGTPAASVARWAMVQGTPALVTVPDVVGETAAAADAILVGGGLVTGTVTTAYSETVAAGLVISQSPTAGSSVDPGSAVDLVISLGPAPPAVWRLLVDGIDQTAHVVACTIVWTLNERTRASVVFNDYLPDRLAEIVIYGRDGITLIFGGVILERHVQGWTLAGPQLKITCECGDGLAYADWVTVSAAYPESTIKTRLTALVDDALDAYGVTLDVAQVDGPTVAAVTWNQKRVSDALRELSGQSGYFLVMSPDRVLTMAAPGGETAPDDWVEPVPTHMQDVAWRDVATVPANKVVLLCGPNGLATIADEHHWGDGSTRIFPLNSPYVAIVGALRTGSDSGGLDPGGFPVGTYGVDDMPWTYDASLNAMRQRTDQTILAADEYIMLWYSAQFPFTVEATTGETPVIEYHEARPDLLSIPAAQQLADELLANMSGDPIILHGRFNEDGYHVGQLLTVDLAVMRQISGTFTIRTITLEMVLNDYWQYTLEATEGTLAAPSHLAGWRQIIGEGYAIPGPWITLPVVRSPTGTITATMPSNIISAGTAAALGGPAFLGGTREGVRTTGTVWEPVSNYIDYYAGVTFSAIVRADLYAARAGVTVKARLWNLTQGKSAGESILVQSTTPVPVVFPVTIEFGNKYRLEKQASGNNEIIHALGTLEAT